MHGFQINLANDIFNKSVEDVLEFILVRRGESQGRKNGQNIKLLKFLVFCCQRKKIQKPEKISDKSDEN